MNEEIESKVFCLFHSCCYSSTTSQSRKRSSGMHLAAYMNQKTDYGDEHVDGIRGQSTTRVTQDVGGYGMARVVERGMCTLRVGVTMT